MPIGAGEPVRVLEVRVPGKVVDGVEGGGSLGEKGVEVPLPAQTFPYLRLLVERFAASILRPRGRREQTKGSGSTAVMQRHLRRRKRLSGT